MSAAARKWLARQRIEGATINAILHVLADAADKNGRVNISQPTIGSRATIGERATRTAISSLDRMGVIVRTRRSQTSGRGRNPDLIWLQLDRDFDLSKDEISAHKTVGITGTKSTKNGWEQPAPNGGSNRHNMPVGRSAPTASRVYYNNYTSRYGRIYKCSGRIWIERSRQKWRAQISIDRIALDLGRFESDTDATRALGGAFADVETTLQGEVKYIVRDVSFVNITNCLPDDFSSAWLEKYSYRGCVI